MSLNKRGYLYLLLTIIISGTSSCINTKSITYFNDLPDSTLIGLASLQAPEQKIQVNDQLSVRVGGDNENTVSYINQFFAGAGANGGNGFQSIVDAQGNIELPKINKIKVEGLTRDEAATLISKAYSAYIIGVLVTVQYINFRFAVLGEVNSPGYFSIPNERINLFEAIAQAGDMTNYATRENVKLIRDNNGQRQIISLNFNDRNILNTPWYYLNRNDIIYVAPRQSKVALQNISPALAITSTSISVIVLLISIFRK